MNRLNWIQQEQKIADYHVLTWPTSHFHSRTLVNVSGTAKSKQESGGMPASDMPKSADAIGFGLTDRTNQSQWKAGGLGPDGLMENGRKDSKSNEILSSPCRKPGRQTQNVEQTAPLLPGIMTKETYHVFLYVRQSVATARDRIKQSMGRLQNSLKGQPQKQSVKTSVKQGEKHKTPEKEKRGTRKATKEDVLFMQSQNHYLLDSYDKNGRHSMLGK